jgi:1-acyl-sn-glycerol-3-phosphate acyltransferase
MKWGGTSRILTFAPMHQIMAAYVFYATLLLVTLFNTFILGLRVVGWGNLRRLPKGGAFLITNHSLYLDPAIISHVIIPRRTMFSALESTVQARPFLGNYIRFLGAFPIPEQNTLLRLVRPLREALRRGWLVHFFPERDLKWLNRELQPFHPGVFFLAQLLNVPVVPITLVVRHRRLFGVRLGRLCFGVKAVIERPIDPAAFASAGSKRAAAEHMAEHARRLMQDCIDRYGERADRRLKCSRP